MNLTKSLQKQTSIWSLSQTQNLFPNLLLCHSQITLFLERKHLTGISTLPRDTVGSQLSASPRQRAGFRCIAHFQHLKWFLEQNGLQNWKNLYQIIAFGLICSTQYGWTPWGTQIVLNIHPKNRQIQHSPQWMTKGTLQNYIKLISELI